jgi:hypothetical protein
MIACRLITFDLLYVKCKDTALKIFNETLQFAPGGSKLFALNGSYQLINIANSPLTDNARTVSQ